MPVGVENIDPVASIGGKLCIGAILVIDQMNRLFPALRIVLGQEQRRVPVGPSDEVIDTPGFVLQLEEVIVADAAAEFLGAPIDHDLFAPILKAFWVLHQRAPGKHLVPGAMSRVKRHESAIFKLEEADIVVVIALTPGAEHALASLPAGHIPGIDADRAIPTHIAGIESTTTHNGAGIIEPGPGS